MSLFGSIPELLDDEIHAWIEREMKASPGVTRDMLMLTLASALNLQGKRQLYRYMAGETPFPLEKVVRFCRRIGSWRLLQAVNQDGGLIAEPKPDVTKIEGFDLIVEQSHNLREFGELVSAYADATDQVPDELTLRRLEREAREVIQQVNRLVCIYAAMVEQRKAATS